MVGREAGLPDERRLGLRIGVNLGDIITALSKVHWLFVIARGSTFTYKGSAVDVTRVSPELCVRYVLEGRVHKAANKVRITA